MARTAWATLGVALVLGMAGCSSETAKAAGAATETPGSQNHQTAFIATVRKDHDVPRTDENLIDIAQSMCRALENNSPGEVFASLQQGLGDAAPAVMGAGMSAFCPEHLSKIG